MKAQIMNIYNMHGTSRKTGNKYDMKRISILEPLTEIDSENCTRTGFGYVLNDYQVSDRAYSELVEVLKSAKFPVQLNLEVGLLNRETLITGIIPA